MDGDVITYDKHSDVYNWLSLQIINYYRTKDFFSLTSEGKINSYCNVPLSSFTREIKYPFDYVKGNFCCNCCTNLISLIGSPKRIDGFFDCNGCYSLTSLIGFPKYIKNHIDIAYNSFSNISLNKKEYNKYIDMWFELLDSVSEDEKWEYINNYKDRVDYSYKQPIIPKEVMNKYKIEFLLKELNYGRR